MIMETTDKYSNKGGLPNIVTDKLYVDTIGKDVLGLNRSNGTEVIFKEIAESERADGILDGANIEAKFDPSASEIEKEFRLGSANTDKPNVDILFVNHSENDGRLFADKSVVYGSDDYGVVNAGDYDTGDFSVSLSALGQAQTIRNSILLEEDTEVVITDRIGYGMEVKGDLVLRYFGNNYPFTKSETVTSDEKIITTNYCWDYKITNSEKIAEVDLSRVTAKVETDLLSGEQIVTFTIPEDILPRIHHGEHSGKHSIKELPIRLIYRVGLTQEEKKRLADEYKETKSVEMTYYTSRFFNEIASTTVRFKPHGRNPYYKYMEEAEVYSKKENITNTVFYSFAESRNRETGEVMQLLGNNGLLSIFKNDTFTLNVEEKWESDKPHPVSVLIDLYVKGTMTSADGTKRKFTKLYDKEAVKENTGWRYTWTNLPREKSINGCTYSYDTYYVSEEVPNGYKPSYSDGMNNKLTVEEISLNKVETSNVGNNLPMSKEATSGNALKAKEKGLALILVNGVDANGGEVIITNYTESKPQKRLQKLGSACDDCENKCSCCIEPELTQ
jgi:hypothetical protein